MLAEFNTLMHRLYAQSQIEVLQYMYDRRDRAMRRYDIAKHLGMTTTTVNKAIEKLEENHGVKFSKGRAGGVRIKAIIPPKPKKQTKLDKKTQCDRKLWAIALDRIEI